MAQAYRLLIGGIGDDSHSVGMTLLEIAFKEAGYFVENINSLQEKISEDTLERFETAFKFINKLL